VRSALADTYDALGAAEVRRGQKKVALNHFHKARALLVQVVQANPENVRYRTDLARTLNQLGQVLADEGRHDQALSVLRQTVEQRRWLLERDQQPRSQVRNLGFTLRALGDIELRRGQAQAAVRDWQEAIHLLESFTRAQPRNEWFQCDLSDTLMRVAPLYQAWKRWDQAQACYQQARGIRSRQLAINPAEPHVRGTLGEIYYRLALLHFARGQRHEEVRYYQKAQVTLARVAHQSPEFLIY